MSKCDSCYLIREDFVLGGITLRTGEYLAFLINMRTDSTQYLTDKIPNGSAVHRFVFDNLSREDRMDWNGNYYKCKALGHFKHQEKRMNHEC